MSDESITRIAHLSDLHCGSPHFKADLLDYVVRAEMGPNALAWNLEAWARAGSG